MLRRAIAVKVNFQFWGDGTQIQGLTHVQFADGTIWFVLR